MSLMMRYRSAYAITGLPPGREQAIFEKFTRGNDESSITGVGLGLTITRAIIGAHGGQIEAHNRASGGACFVFRLPLGEPPEIASIAEPPEMHAITDATRQGIDA